MDKNNKRSITIKYGKNSFSFRNPRPWELIILALIIAIPATIIFAKDLILELLKLLC